MIDKFKSAKTEAARLRQQIDDLRKLPETEARTKMIVELCTVARDIECAVDLAIKYQHLAEALRGLKS